MALGSIGGLLLASLAKMNLHGAPVEPVPITLGKHLTAMKTFEVVLGYLGGRLVHGSIYRIPRNKVGKKKSGLFRIHGIGRF